MAKLNTLSYGENGLALTQQFEGLRLTAYQDQVGVWTIGYGHTGPDVHPGLTITEEVATALLLNDVAIASACVNKLVRVPLTENQFDALVDFVFNLGAGAFEGSTLLRFINAGNLAAAVGEFPKWCRAGGKVAAGLLRPRQAEARLFRQTIQNT